MARKARRSNPARPPARGKDQVVTPKAACLHAEAVAPGVDRRPRPRRIVPRVSVADPELVDPVPLEKRPERNVVAPG